MIDTDTKHFPEWIELKENIHNSGRLPNIKEGEIWWCAIGENVGVEINGKSKAFSRPALVFKKLSKFGFMGIPLTSQPHEGAWYAQFMFRDKLQVAALAQARVISTSRLYDKLGEISDSDLELIREQFAKLYIRKK